MSNDGNDKVILLAGPTGSGKSALAMEIAERFDGVVINADSMQVYSELRVLSARPSPEDEARVPHRLYGILSGDDPCSAGRWMRMAINEIENVRQAGRVPIVAGGTGLYFSALLQGLAPTPDIPAELRARLQARFDDIGPSAFHAELEQRDPIMAERTPATDRQRLLRAFEVIEATGISLAEWQNKDSAIRPLLLPWLGLVVKTPRRELYARCDRRFDQMVAAGALMEVEALMARQLDPELPIMKALGVPELISHIRGEIDLDTAATAVKTGTRRYAKRQLTWLRRNMISWKEVSLEDIFKDGENFFSFISHFLLTGDS